MKELFKGEGEKEKYIGYIRAPSEECTPLVCVEAKLDIVGWVFDILNFIFKFPFDLLQILCGLAIT